MRYFSVRLNERLVGHLQVFAEDERTIFRFAEAWLEAPDRPTLGQFFEDRRPDPIDHSGFMSWFSNLLPQGAWASLLERTLGLEEQGEYLEALGADLPGAVIVERFNPIDEPSTPEAPGRQIPTFSLAGAQGKMSGRQGEGGYVVPLSGDEGDLVLKLESPDYEDLPRREFLASLWARHSGLTTPDTRLEPDEKLPEAAQIFTKLPRGHFFVSRRFDRQLGGPRIHYEDFAQVLGRPPSQGGIYTGRYEDLAVIVRELAPDDRGEFLGRIVHMVARGDFDGHLKNWALIYEDGRTPRLSPAYDLVPTVLYPPSKIDHEWALELGGSREDEDWSLARFAPIIESLGLSEIDGARRLREWADRIAEALEAPEVSEQATSAELSLLERRATSLAQALR